MMLSKKARLFGGVRYSSWVHLCATDLAVSYDLYIREIVWNKYSTQNTPTIQHLAVLNRGSKGTLNGFSVQRTNVNNTRSLLIVLLVLQYRNHSNIKLQYCRPGMYYLEVVGLQMDIIDFQGKMIKGTRCSFLDAQKSARSFGVKVKISGNIHKQTRVPNFSYCTKRPFQLHNAIMATFVVLVTDFTNLDNLTNDLFILNF